MIQNEKYHRAEILGILKIQENCQKHSIWLSNIKSNSNSKINLANSIWNYQSK